MVPVLKGSEPDTEDIHLLEYGAWQISGTLALLIFILPKPSTHQPPAAVPSGRESADHQLAFYAASGDHSSFRKGETSFLMAVSADFTSITVLHIQPDRGKSSEDPTALTKRQLSSQVSIQLLVHPLNRSIVFQVVLPSPSGEEAWPYLKAAGSCERGVQTSPGHPITGPGAALSVSGASPLLALREVLNQEPREQRENYSSFLTKALETAKSPEMFGIKLSCHLSRKYRNGDFPEALIQSNHVHFKENMWWHTTEETIVPDAKNFPE
ncbi:uncharacterized protein [Vicugna pacos]|uniref:Uncharacterized protein n=1 Tax=Vicugna pacos TaxID=30538 RepID=A0ABM5BDA9_VICPA